MDILYKKQQLISKLIAIIDQKITLLEALIDAAKESRNGETKSTVGDKYETARAMADIEIRKNQNQLNKWVHQRNDLQKIAVSYTHESAGYGSVIITNESNYFIAVGIGKVHLGGELFLAVSLASPMGNILKDKKTGDSFRFNGTDIKIEQIG